MRTASVSELKSRLSEFLRLVRGGDTVMVMDRGHPVALLGPCQGVESELAELRDAGLVRVGSGEIPADFWTRSRSKDPQASVRAAVREEREEGW
jgi:antitoxin (DNA-binding transcriptional repressor) of toxin-antitoxin stability system